MPKYYLIATTPQGAAFAIGPLDDPASDELYDEVESWGWDVHTGSAGKMTVAQARKYARQEEK